MDEDHLYRLIKATVVVGKVHDTSSPHNMLPDPKISELTA